MLGRFIRIFVLLSLGWLLSPDSDAHPVPDVPVRGFFEKDGSFRIQVEVDPRCFDEDPTNAASLLNEFAKTKPAADRAEMGEQAKAFLTRTVEFHLDPLGRIIPDFKFELTGKNGATLAKDDDVVVITGTWRSTVPSGIRAYYLRATPETKLSVLFINHLRGEPVERTQVLFPNEKSFLLDLSGLTATVPVGPAPGTQGVKSGIGAWVSTFANYFRQGFLHVLPLGLDHILFVLGLFLLCREWKPMLWQVSAFTVAHTITLALATFSVVNVPGKVVEPVIAASLIVVALENIFRPKYSNVRLLVVFAFGLVHGLGFAGALQDLELPTSSLVVGLLSFNLGVEGGQLAVIALAFAATIWLRDPVLYRRFIVIPGSVAIACMGAWWTVFRVFQ